MKGIRKKLIPLLLIGSYILAGCSSQSFIINGVSGADKITEESQTFFIGGIGQKKSVDAAKVCGGPEKIAMIESRETFMNGFFDLISFGIYTPREAIIYCK